MLDRFAKLLGIRPDQAEDALRSERAAKHVVSRRSFFGAAAALATGAVFSFGGVEVAEPASPLLENMRRLADEMRKFKPAPHVVLMNPRDYAQLRAMLPEAMGQAPFGVPVLADHYMARGQAIGFPRTWLDPFKGIDRDPIKVGASIHMSGRT